MSEILIKEHHSGDKPLEAQSVAILAIGDRQRGSSRRRGIIVHSPAIEATSRKAQIPDSVESERCSCSCSWSSVLSRETRRIAQNERNEKAGALLSGVQMARSVVRSVSAGTACSYAACLLYNTCIIWYVVCPLFSYFLQILVLCGAGCRVTYYYTLCAKRSPRCLKRRVMAKVRTAGWEQREHGGRWSAQDFAE